MADHYKIAVLPGDGIGPEVIAEAVKILRSTELDLEFLYGEVGSQAYNATGTPIPENTKVICEKSDAVLLGAIGHSYAPYGISALVTKYFRRELKAYVNVCPLKLYPGIFFRDDPPSITDIDIVIIRSNIEGFILEHDGDLWGGEGKDVRVITRSGAEKVAKYACNYARRKGRKKITCIDAHNLLYGDKLFRDAFNDVANDFPEVQNEYLSINVASMMLAMKPWVFDMILTHDIFGEVMVWHTVGNIGGIGMASQASMGDDFAVFQPLGGAAWGIAGKNIANPFGSILAAKHMLEWLGHEKEAEIIEHAVKAVIKEGEILTPDLMGTNHTSEVGDAIKSKIMPQY